MSPGQPTDSSARTTPDTTAVTTATADAEAEAAARAREATRLSPKARASFPLPDVTWPMSAPYFEWAEKGELRIPFCDACGLPSWYPKATCNACRSTALTWKQLSGRGTVFSFVVVRHVFLPQYADLVPFVAGLVTPDEATNVRLTTRIVDVDPDAVAIGMTVEAVFRPLAFAGVEGEVTAPLFRPVSR